MSVGRKDCYSLLPLLVVLSIAMAFLASGCLWGVVRDADTGAPLPGVTVSFSDGAGHSNSTTTDANGLYVFDQATGPVPSTAFTAQPVVFQLSAPGYMEGTATPPIRYDDNPHASLENPSSFWEVQHFDLVPVQHTIGPELPCPEPQPGVVTRVSVQLSGVDVNEALLAPIPYPLYTRYRVEFRAYDPTGTTAAACVGSSTWFEISSTDPAPQDLSAAGLDYSIPGDHFRVEVTVVLQRAYSVKAPGHGVVVETGTSTAAFEWTAPGSGTSWQSATLDSTDAAAPDDPDLQFTAEIAYRSVVE